MAGFWDTLLTNVKRAAIAESVVGIGFLAAEYGDEVAGTLARVADVFVPETNAFDEPREHSVSSAPRDHVRYGGRTVRRRGGPSAHVPPPPTRRRSPHEALTNPVEPAQPSPEEREAAEARAARRALRPLSNYTPWSEEDRAPATSTIRYLPNTFAYR